MFRQFRTVKPSNTLFAADSGACRAGRGASAKVYSIGIIQQRPRFDSDRGLFFYNLLGAQSYHGHEEQVCGGSVP